MAVWKDITSALGHISSEHKYGEIPLAKEQLWADLQHGSTEFLL